MHQARKRATDLFSIQVSYLKENLPATSSGGGSQTTTTSNGSVAMIVLVFCTENEGRAEVTRRVSTTCDEATIEASLLLLLYSSVGPKRIILVWPFRLDPRHVHTQCISLK
jgi:hypothetical protein